MRRDLHALPRPLLSHLDVVLNFLACRYRTLTDKELMKVRHRNQVTDKVILRGIVDHVGGFAASPVLQGLLIVLGIGLGQNFFTNSRNHLK